MRLRWPHSTLATVTKTILIAPFDGPLASALGTEASAQGWSVALAMVRGPSAAAAAKAAPGVVTLAYDPRSYVSASSLVLSAINALGGLDAAILILDPASAKADFLSGRPGELSGLVEERCSGPLFLARELVRRFEARKSGAILLLAPENPRDSALGPIASMASGAFEGLGRASSRPRPGRLGRPMACAMPAARAIGRPVTLSSCLGRSSRPRQGVGCATRGRAEFSDKGRFIPAVSRTGRVCLSL